MKTGFIIFLMALSLGSFNGLSIKAEDYLIKLKSNYDRLKSFQLEMDYKLYRTGRKGDIIERYQSIYFGSKKSSYRKIKDTEIIIKNNIEMRIDHVQKSIVLGQARDLELFDVGIEESLKWCEKITVEIRGKNRRIHLFLKEGQDILFSKITIEVDENIFVKEISLAYSTKVNFSKDYFNPDMDYPTMVISYSNFKDGWKDKKGLLDLSRYVELDNRKVIAQEEYKEFEIIDLRNYKKGNYDK